MWQPLHNWVRSASVSLSAGSPRRAGEVLQRVDAAFFDSLDPGGVNGVEVLPRDARVRVLRAEAVAEDGEGGFQET